MTDTTLDDYHRDAQTSDTQTNSAQNCDSQTSGALAINPQSINVLASHADTSDTHDTQILVALAGVDGVGQATLCRLRDCAGRMSGGLDELWQCLDSSTFLAQSGLLDLDQQVALQYFRQIYTPSSFSQMLSEKNIQVVIDSDAIYPKLLWQAEGRPVVLFVRGDPSCWDALPIAVVGTRKATPYGTQVTQKIVSELCSLGATIVSGFMYGIDIIAHQAAMAAGGRSVAVLGFGFDHIYPPSHAPLLAEFLDRGNVCVTEFPPYLRSRKHMFPMRNRIVAGLCHSVVVTEAAHKSGSLITVRYALEYNRSVCAVPGPITSIYSDGTKDLINMGAIMVSSGVEVMDDIAASVDRTQSSVIQSRDSLSFPRPKRSHNLRSIPMPISLTTPIEQKMFQLLQTGPQTSDSFLLQVQAELSLVLQALTRLEILGLVECQGEFWSLRT